MTGDNAIDTDAYFRRIGFLGSPRPDLDTLRELIRLHCSAIAYENLGPLLDEPVSLELDALQAKLVHSRRGGYCYEHNTLFHAVLEQIGFDVTPLSARTLWGAPLSAVTKQGHMLLRVIIENEPWIADVGFGGMTLTGPLRLTLDAAQATPHEPFRLIQLDDDYAMQALVGDEWRATYRFDLRRQYPIDYVAVNWYLSTCPASLFKNGLLVARAAEGRRLALGNRHLSIYHTSGEIERRTLSSATELIDTLQQDFLLELPTWTPLEEAFDRLP